jgi:hypothetical protein
MRQDHGVDHAIGDRQLCQPGDDFHVSRLGAPVGNNRMSPRPTTGQQSGAFAPSSQLKQLPAENIVQRL